jgi:hypothetical protein
MMTTQNMKRNVDDDKPKPEDVANAAKAAEAAAADYAAEVMKSLPFVVADADAAKAQREDRTLPDVPDVKDLYLAYTRCKAQREDRTVGGDHDNTAAFVAEHKPTP